MDASGNVYLTGSFAGSIDLGCGPLVTTGCSDVNAFVAKLSSTGSCVWSKSAGDGSTQIADAVALDPSGQPVIAGHFGGTLDLGCGPITSLGGFDAFVTSLTSAGSCAWTKGFGGTGDQIGNALAIDSIGRIALAGSLQGSAGFGSCGVLTSAGSSDVFLTMLTSTGTCLSAKRFGDAGNQVVGGIAVDASRNVLLTGSFAGSIDFGSGPLTSAGSTDVFVAQFAP